MSTQVMATVVDGELKLDQPLELPDKSRVKVMVEVEETTEARRARKRRAFEELERLCREKPINSGGLHFTRDQLHERD